MKKDYIKIYNNAYSKSEILAEKEIITKFIDFKERGRNSSKAGNVIEQEFEKEKSNCRVMDKSLQSLFYLFRNRLDEFTEDTQMNVIPEILLPEFDKIIHSDNFSFENYIKELADFNARYSVHNTFSNNRPLYHLMFELNDFSEFSIIGCYGDYNSEIYEKYRKLNHEKSAIKTVKVLTVVEKKEESEPNFYLIKDTYYKKFLSQIFYDYLKNNFVNDQKTSYQDFIDVFTIDHNNHSKEIHFYCTTKLASYLLSKLQKEIFYKLNMSKFATNSLRTSKGGSLRGNNISQSKSNKSEMDERIVNDAMEYLKEIKIPTCKSE
jgi:hypothetical protein